MRRIIPLTALLVISLAATLVAVSRTPASLPVTFSGTAVDDATGAPLAGVAVTVQGTPYSALTGPTGRYTLTVPREQLASNTVQLVASRAGYQPAELLAGIAADLVQLDFRLHSVSSTLESVVTAGRAEGQELAERSVQDAAAAAAPPNVGAGATVGNHAGDYSRHYAPGEWNTEAYAHIAENGFVPAAGNPLSTFSIDVDRASYSNVRRFILDGQLPPKDAVRTEEMINYFTYEYPTGGGGHPFGVTAEVSPAPWSAGHLLLRVGLASAPVQAANLPPSNLVFLIDVSGSMQSPDKLPLVKQSLRLLVSQLRPRDRVAIVVYAGAAGLVLPSTPGSHKGKILMAVEALEAGGSTAGGEGLRLAYDVAREHHLREGNNRVILASDGDFNVGVSSDSEMIRLVEEKRRQGTFLTVLGFGTGNLQDSKMEQMADHGNGNYAYIDSLLEARKVLVSEMGGTLLTVANDVKLQVEFNPARVRAYRLIGYENRLLAAEDFNDDRKDAGELGAGHTVTALYEVVPQGVESDVESGGVDPLRYQQPPARAQAAASSELAFVRVRYKRPGAERSLLLEEPVLARGTAASPDMKFAAAVAGFAMLLRDSEHRGSLTPERVLSLAREGRGSDPEGYRTEFVQLVQLYQSLAGGHTAAWDGPRR